MSINDEWKEFLAGLAAPKVGLKTKDVKTKGLKDFTTGANRTATATPRQGALISVFDALIESNKKAVQK